MSYDVNGKVGYEVKYCSNCLAAGILSEVRGEITPSALHKCEACGFTHGGFKAARAKEFLQRKIDILQSAMAQLNKNDLGS